VLSFFIIRDRFSMFACHEDEGKEVGMKGGGLKAVTCFVGCVSRCVVVPTKTFVHVDK
jgi:hypothetical protein